VAAVYGWNAVAHVKGRCGWACIYTEWQHLIDFSSYKLSAGGFVNVDLAAALNGQPLQLTVYDTKVRVGKRCKRHLESKVILLPNSGCYVWLKRGCSCQRALWVGLQKY
jgi:hypothetical protein